MPSPEDIPAMLKEIGKPSLDSLFSEIPGPLRKKSLRLPEHIPEFELIKKVQEIASENKWTEFTNFSGPRNLPGGVHNIIYSVPARGLPGYPAGSIRISERDVRPHGDGRFQLLDV